MGYLQSKLEKVGVTGSLFAAAACPICFPKLAAIGAIFGMGALAPFENYFFWGAQVFVLLTVIGQAVAFKLLKNRVLQLLSITSAVLFFLSLYVAVSETLSYVALAGIVLCGIWMVIEDRKKAACQVKAGYGEPQ
ncbi:MAG: hypothetical protein V7739_11035 [Motiliproteus sp.]